MLRNIGLFLLMVAATVLGVYAVEVFNSLRMPEWFYRIPFAAEHPILGIRHWWYALQWALTLWLAWLLVAAVTPKKSGQ